MKNLKLLIVVITVILNDCLIAQGVSINDDGSTADTSAMLDVKSSNKGFLPPRMSESERTGIASPATGLLVYQTTQPAGYYYYYGTNWIALTGAGAGAILNSSCIDYDSNAYPTFIIGPQVWMAENLRV